MVCTLRENSVFTNRSDPLRPVPARIHALRADCRSRQSQPGAAAVAYPKLSGFTESNDAYLEVAVDLGEQAMRKALAEANIEPHEVDTIVMVSSTGIAVPTIDARLMSRIGLRPNIKRVPLFVFGCADMSTWVCHSGGPKVLESVENTLGLPASFGAQPEFDAGERQHVLGIRA